MKANLKKSSGFFIVEILVVLVIVGILVAALLPNLTTYTNRSKFVDVINSVSAVRPAVDSCIMQNGSLTTCNTGSFGIPNTPGSAGNFLSYTIAAGVITATSTTGVGGTYTFILTPTLVNGSNASQGVTWAQSGTCKAAGLC